MLRFRHVIIVVSSLFFTGAIFAPSLSAQAKHEGLGYDGSGFSKPDPSLIQSHLVQSHLIMAMISPDGKTAAGMGVDSGKWVSTPLKNESGKAIVICSSSLAVIKDDESIHVLDQKGKEWKSIQLEGDHSQEQPLAGNFFAGIQCDRHIYAYGVGASAWSKLVLPEEDTNDYTLHIENHYMTARSDKSIFTYTASADRWTGVRFKPNAKGEIEIINGSDEQ